MPVTAQTYYKQQLEGPKGINVHRSQSLRSELSNNSQQSKRVSFNRDVHIKRIPRGYETDPNGKLVAVLRSPGLHNSSRLWVNDAELTENPNELYNEAQNVLKLVENLSCSVSPSNFYSLERPPKKSSTSLQKSQSKLSDFFRTNGSKKKLRSQSSATESLTNLNINASPSPDFQFEHNRNANVNDWRTERVRPQLKKRSGLNSIGETPTNSSGSDDKDLENRKIIQEMSESPISSLSGPEDAAEVLRRYSNSNSNISNLPPIINRAHSTRAPPQRPPLPKFQSYKHSSNLNGNVTSNVNDKLFDQFRKSTPERTNSTIDRKITTKPSEVIYAQVVVSEPRNGLVTKKTIHRSVPIPNSRIVNDNFSQSSQKQNQVHNPSISPTAKAYSSLSVIDMKPKNITTVVINDKRNYHNHNDEIELEKQQQQQQQCERPFFYGDSISRSLRQRSLNPTFSPYFEPENFRTLNLSLSPSTISSSKLVPQNDKIQDNFTQSDKLVKFFGPIPIQMEHESDTSNIRLHGEDKKTVFENNRIDYNNKRNGRNFRGNITVKFEDDEPDPISIPNGYKYYNRNGIDRPSSSLLLKNGFSNHSNSLEVLFKKKNGEDAKEKEIPKRSSEKNGRVTNLNNGSGGGGGLISTLMRRNTRDVKKSGIPKEKSEKNSIERNSNKASEVKQPRTKFLSGFLEKNFTLRRNGKLTLDKSTAMNHTRNSKEVPTVTLNSNHILNS